MADSPWMMEVASPRTKMQPLCQLFIFSERSNVAFGPAVLRYNGTTGAFIDAFVPQYSGGILQPYSLAFGPNGNLYVSDLQPDIYSGLVREYNGTTGAFIGNFNSVSFPGGTDAITFGPNGNLYETDQTGNEILEFNGATGAFMSVFASGGGLSHPSGLAFGPDGNLYVASGGGLGNPNPSGAILVFNGQNGAFIKTFASNSEWDGPYSVAVSPALSTVPEPGSLTLSLIAGVCFSVFAIRRGPK